MALMFARLAQNFVKAGYYPTDEVTLERIVGMMRCAGPGPFRLLDPCCGEGAALADVRHGLLQAARTESNDGDLAKLPAIDIEALGVEFDKERAWHAKQVLGRVIHADFHDVVVKARSIGLLFLNPPYGFGVADQANGKAGDADAEKAERLERTFLFKSTPLLATGGILVFVVPRYALDEEMRSYLSRNYQDVRVFMAPEQRFKQCVVIGRRRKAGNPTKAIQDVRRPRSTAPTCCPRCGRTHLSWCRASRPRSSRSMRCASMRSSSATSCSATGAICCGRGLRTNFRQTTGACQPPLREMTPWHMALALAAGQITGRFRSEDGRVFLLKGDTYKRKQRSVATEVDEKGEVTQIVTMLDRFVPVINAIEFTPDHRLGQIVKIT
jgi:tRNA1(Val) A37 N6-methylase TrmN6